VTENGTLGFKKHGEVIRQMTDTGIFHVSVIWQRAYEYIWNDFTPVEVTPLI
jgi:hypothetical protein